LAEVKELVWTDISKSINEIWPMVQIMFEQNELLERSKQAVEKIRTELGDMPAQANDIIRFLNSKTREELEELKIEDRTETILEVKTGSDQERSHASARGENPSNGSGSAKVFPQDRCSAEERPAWHEGHKRQIDDAPDYKKKLIRGIQGLC
jgi:hypothetical protein